MRRCRAFSIERLSIEIQTVRKSAATLHVAAHFSFKMLSLADFQFTMLGVGIAMGNGNGDCKGKEVARMMQKCCKDAARRLH